MTKCREDMKPDVSVGRVAMTASGCANRVSVPQERC